MITIKHLDKKYVIKNKLSELTINEYENIQTLINLENTEYFEKYMEVLRYLGLPYEVVNDMDLDNLLNFIKQLENTKIKGYKKTITIDGNKFVGIEKGKDTPTLTPRALKLIEKAMKDNQQKNVAEIMAILFKFESDTEVEHYSVAHLKWKTHLFRTQVTSDIALPYVVYISQKILSNIKAISVNAE